MMVAEATGRAAPLASVRSDHRARQAQRALGGYTWWNVNYDSSCDGWSVQNYLTTSL
jgi:hypothetical protein